jgi:hypothetical protein
LRQFKVFAVHQGAGAITVKPHDRYEIPTLENYLNRLAIDGYEVVAITSDNNWWHITAVQNFTPQYRHRMRETEYQVLGVGTLQISTKSLQDNDRVVVYRDKEGNLWVRELMEFHDGRFEVVKA